MRAPWDRLGGGWRAAAAAAGLALAVAAVAVPAVLLLRGEDASRLDEIASFGRGSGDDPLAYSPDRRQELELRASVGLSHVVYERSPGGVEATAQRTVRFREGIERAASESGADPDLMEAMVFLESAGRPQVIAGDDPEAASGLAQIVASTGTDLLGMRVDLEASRALTERIAALSALAPRLRRLARRLSRQAAVAAEGRKRRILRRAAAAHRELSSIPARRRRLIGRRALVDERFDPRAAIAGMARYLRIARRRFGREDLAIAAYHMGIGNLEDVVRRYVRPGDASGPIRDVVEREGVSYAALFFDSSPLRNPRTYALLSSFGDDSSTYLWRVLASRDAMTAYRTDRDGLRHLAELHAAKATAEEVFHPRSETEVIDDPGELERAWREGSIVAIPNTEDFRVGRQLGELADDVGVERKLYRGLNPTALATLAYMAARVRAITGRDERLVVTSAIRDRGYQEALTGVNSEATTEYSLHTTGWAFDVWRRYRSDAQAQAFQHVLDRLKAMAILDYAVEPEAIHVTVSPAAEPLLG